MDYCYKMRRMDYVLNSWESHEHTGYTLAWQSLEIGNDLMKI